MITPHAERLRVSTLERLVPSLGLALAALSGAVGAGMIVRFLSLLKQAATAGLYSFFAGIFEVEFVVGIVLVVAAILVVVGLVVSGVRLFTTNTKSSPSGLWFLVFGLLSLIPPFAIHYLLHLMKEVVTSPEQGGISGIAGKVATLSWIAVGFAIVIPFALLAFSFIPFSSRAGRKASTLLSLVVVAIAIFVMAGIFFWEARTSRAEQDKQVEEYSQPSEPPTMSPTPGEDDSDPDFVRDADTDNDPGIYSNSKTISGGILNAKSVGPLPMPEYPPAARAVHASGQVNVQVTVNEQGNVIEAAAVSGHPLLRASAVQAARRARFAPTKLSGQPVKVTGILTYNFPVE